jgi:hypothetical protein
MEFLDTQNPSILLILVIIALTLVRLVERLVDKLLIKHRNGKKSIAPRPAGGCNGLTPEEHAALIRLDEMHAKYDSDGTPLWYVPRSLTTMIAEIVKTQDRIAVRLRDVVKTQDAILQKVGKVEDATGRIDVPIRR